MDEYNLALLVMAFSLFLIFLGFLIWGIRTGQFTDIEEAKYRILEIPDSIPENTERTHQGGKI